jgi:hypothetical protein
MSGNKADYGSRRRWVCVNVRWVSYFHSRDLVQLPAAGLTTNSRRTPPQLYVKTLHRSASVFLTWPPSALNLLEGQSPRAEPAGVRRGRHYC